jgi:uncharacterized protein (DUF1800 family)
VQAQANSLRQVGNDMIIRCVDGWGVSDQTGHTMNPKSKTAWVSQYVGCLLLLGGSVASWAQTPAVPDTVKVILIDGDMREDWPDKGSVAFHRESTVGALVVNYSLAGTALRAVDYTVPVGTSITIPDGEREAWLELAPVSDALKESTETITVKLEPGAGYVASTTKALTSAALTLGDASVKPGSKAAVRFLYQAAFGPSADSSADVDVIPQNAQSLMAVGFDSWINTQFARPVGKHQPYIDYLIRVKKGSVYSDSRVLSWWRRAMEVPSLYPGALPQSSDVLRQRVGFALSEIMVISDFVDELANQPSGMTNYYDMLLKHSFGNFRTLLHDVAIHPCMGIYLNHLGNDKGEPDHPTEPTFPDENFAREIMQLFSIGLWELNNDGTRKLDEQGQPIPTYDNDDIMAMAQVMTGFSWGGKKGTNFYWSESNYKEPMRMYDEFHELRAKTLLNGVTLPARTASDPDKGTAGLADFNAAIDCLFNHPSCPPFICRQLIQKLVTSNPTPAYVGRVSAAFIDNGKGVRGDMKAVIRAILLDTEARDPAMLSYDDYGKMKEPYLRTANLVRAFNAKAGNGNYQLSYLRSIHAMEPMSSPSVFNFFKPGFSPAGEINDAGLVAPEFQILNDVTSLSVPNYYFNVFEYNSFNRWASAVAAENVRPQISVELSLYNDVPKLLRRLDMALTGGTLPNEQHQLIREAVESINDTMYGWVQDGWKKERIRMAIYLIATTPEAGIQR